MEPDTAVEGGEVQTFVEANGVVRVISCSYCEVRNGMHADGCPMNRPPPPVTPSGSSERT